MIDSIKFGSITVNGQTHHNDVIVTWEDEVKDIDLTKRHLFDIPEFSQITSKPELLILGSGDSDWCKISDGVRKLCEESEIEIIEMPSRKAVERFNELSNQEKKVVAFIHVTC